MRKTIATDVVAHFVSAMPATIMVRPPSYVRWLARNVHDYRTVMILPGDDVPETLLITAGCSTRSDVEYICLVNRCDESTVRAFECVAAWHLEASDVPVVGSVINVGASVADESPLTMVFIAADDVLRGDLREVMDVDGRDIHFHRMVPIYPEEADAVRRSGPNWFFDQCDEHDISSCDMDRPMLPLEAVKG